MFFDYSYNLTALAFIAVLTIHFHLSPIFPNRANKLFSLVLIVGTLSLIFDLLTFYCINNRVNIYVNYAVNILFFLLNWIIPYLLLRYVIALAKHELKVDLITKYVPVLLIVINYSILLTTPFTHYIFYYDNQVNYLRGDLFLFVVFNQLVLLFWGVFYALLKRKYLKRNQVIIISFYIILTTFAALIQLNFPHASIISASIALSIFLMYVTLLNPAEYLDTMTNVYNRMAFDEYIYTLITKRIPFNFIVVDIEGTTRINKFLSENFGNQVIKNIATELNTLKKHCLVFRIEGDKFVIISKKDKIKRFNLDQFQSKFPLTVHHLDITLEIKVHIAYSDNLIDIASTSEMIDLINFICKKSKDENEISRLNLDNITEYRYNEKRNLAIMHAIENEEIELNLQAIFDTRTKQFTTAEALCRINTKYFGYISPSVFIPFAEKKGIINQLSLAMIKKVCIFISESKLPDNFTNISINLSVIDCLDPTFPKKIITFLNYYKINKKKFLLK